MKAAYMKRCIALLVNSIRIDFLSQEDLYNVFKLMVTGKMERSVASFVCLFHICSSGNKCFYGRDIFIFKSKKQILIDGNLSKLEVCSKSNQTDEKLF